MAVDFEFGKAPSYRVAYVRWKGPWNDRKIRSRFESVDRWIRNHRMKAGKWIFLEPADRRWEAAIEVRGKPKGDGAVRVRTLKGGRVARVIFNPDKLSPRVVYHGLSDWLRWRKKEKEIRRVVSSREVYSGNPWTDKKAWSKTEVQFLVKP